MTFKKKVPGGLRGSACVTIRAQKATKSTVRSSRAVCVRYLDHDDTDSDASELELEDAAIEEYILQDQTFDENELEEDDNDKEMPMAADTDDNTTIASLDLRAAIGNLFLRRFGNETEESWDGQNGVASIIREIFSLNPNMKVKAIFKEALRCSKEDLPYKGHRQVREGKTLGRNAILATVTPEAQVFADALESGSSFPEAVSIVNAYRKKHQLPSLTKGPLRNLLQRLGPQIKKVERRSQGSDDPTSAWARARWYWNTQLLIRFDRLPSEEIEKLKDANGNLPLYFQKNLLTPLNIEGIVWWDETHRKCLIGSAMEFHFRFKRDTNGKLDNNGTFAQGAVSKMNVKFEKEVRLGLGCAVVAEKDGVPCHGVVAKEYNYTSKLMVGLKKWYRFLGEATEAVKRDRSPNSPWEVDVRDKTKKYEGEKVSVLKNIAGATASKLGKHGVVLVKDMADLSLDKLNHILQCEQRLPYSKLKAAWDIAQTALPGSPPPKIDYRKHDNPYEARFGDNWESEIRKHKNLSSFVPVTDYILDIYNEGRRIYHGTDYEASWMFYHDALNQMTEKDTMKWMQEKGILKHWILPEQMLLHDIPGLSAYRDRPIGNSPENMPWDNSLNQDLHMGVNRHCSITQEMSEDDPRKFSLSSPARGLHAYRRVLEGCPSSERILKDCERVLTSLEVVRKKNGILCPELGSTNKGKRREMSAGGNNHGGKRIRKQALDDYGDRGWTHADAKAAVSLKVEHSEQRHSNTIGVKHITDKI
jgi:hypothetical protein